MTAPKFRSRLSSLHFIFTGFLAIAFSGCATVMNQVEGMLTLTKCEFRLAAISDVQLAGVSIERMTSPSDLSFTDAAKLALALTQNELPLSFRLNVEVKNPNQRAATLSRFQWRLFIDDLEMTAGTVASPVSVDAGAVSGVPMEMRFDLKKALTGRSLEAIKNFAFNLAGVGGKPTRVMLRMKPSIQVGSMTVQYPNEIDVRTEFTGGR